MFSYTSPYTAPYNQPTLPFNNPSYPQSQNNGGIKWVNGIESAQMYNMPPNSEELLMDQNANRFYLKKTDASGQYTIAAFDFAPAQQPQTAYQLEESIKADLDDLRSKVENIETQLFGDDTGSSEGDSDVKHSGKQQSTTNNSNQRK